MKDRTTEIFETEHLARRAVTLGNEDAVALCWGGFSLGYVVRDFDDSVAYLERALQLNPNLAAAYYLSGWLRIYIGQPEQALERFAKAVRLSPLDPLIFRAHAGIAYGHFFAGRHHQALVWAEQAERARPNWLTAVRIAAACYAVEGRIEEARKLGQRIRELDPALRLSNLTNAIPIMGKNDAQKLSDALRIAGLEE